MLIIKSSVDAFAHYISLVSLESFLTIIPMLTRDIMLDHDWGETGSSHSIFVSQVGVEARHGIL
jgi:hypothetical protein